MIDENTTSLTRSELRHFLSLLKQRITYIPNDIVSHYLPRHELLLIASMIAEAGVDLDKIPPGRGGIESLFLDLWIFTENVFQANRYTNPSDRWSFVYRSSGMGQEDPTMSFIASIYANSLP